MIPPEQLPGEVFQACPTGRSPRASATPAGVTVHVRLPAVSAALGRKLLHSLEGHAIATLSLPEGRVLKRHCPGSMRSDLIFSVLQDRLLKTR